MALIESEASVAAEPVRISEATFRDYFELLKPRVMSLVIFTAFVGLIAAPGPIHPWIAAMALLAIAVGAGASGALNMWYDADIDATMRRTAKRPVPRGAILPGEALGFGLTLSAGSVLFLGLMVNAAAGALLAFTILFYIVIYTMWLKRRTPQNIVIGGAAGAFPPMIGWVAVTGRVDLGAIALFLIIFMWTPPHFWALALFMNDDYDKARVPMLTVTHGRRATRAHILVYTVALMPVALAAAFTTIGGPIYFAVSLVLNVLFLIGAIRIWRRPEETAQADNYAVEKRFFALSLAYLFLHFMAFLVEATPWADRLAELAHWGTVTWG